MQVRKLLGFTQRLSFVHVSRESQSFPISWGCVRSLSKLLPREWRDPKKAVKKPKREAVQDEEFLPIVAIIGRPNVGKSALFNRFGRERRAVVYNTPDGHVTRDYREGIGSLGDLRFKVVDTSGLEPFMTADTILARATRITQDVLRQCDLALFMLDSRTGVLPGDQELGAWLRSHTTAPVVLVANKAEARGRDSSFPAVGEVVADATRLGFGEPIAISAETGEGLVDLYSALQPLVDRFVKAKKRAKPSAPAGTPQDTRDPEEPAKPQEELSDGTEGRSPGDPQAGPIKLAIVGEPNVGKSTLANMLLGKERSLTGPEAGLTRDAVESSFAWQGRRFQLLDTAGWLRPAKIPSEGPGQAIMEAAMTQAERGWNMAHVVLMMMDAERAAKLGKLDATSGKPLTQTEVSLAGKVIGEGRALLVVVNKMDTLQPSHTAAVAQVVEEALERQLPEVVGVTCLCISALSGAGIERIMPAAVQAHDTWALRVSTARLNRWLLRLVEQYKGTAQGREVLRIRYITQVSTRPPSFVAFMSGSGLLQPGFQRFLLNKLRAYFGFPGVPMRLTLRSKKVQDKQAAAPSFSSRSSKSQKVGVWMARKPPKRKKKLPKKDPFAWLRP